MKLRRSIMLERAETIGNPMKILIPALVFGQHGGYRVLSELANAWIKMGHECTFLVPSDAGEPYFPTKAKKIYAFSDGSVLTESGGPTLRGSKRIRNLFLGLRTVGRDYDVVLANHSLTAWPVRWARCGRAKKLYYIQAYEPDYYGFFKDPKNFIASKLSYMLKLTQITNSETYTSAGIRPFDCIPPGVDISKFHPKENLTPKFANMEHITLGTVGRLEPYKGTDAALAAYRKLRKSDDRYRMSVAFGNVSPAPDINIVPISSDAALAEYYRSVDILLVTCRGQHGAPHYPLIEAMASGTPVVHTGYFPGDPNNSWQTTDTSVEAIVASVTQLVVDPNIEARILAARMRIETELSWEATATRFIRNFNAIPAPPS